MKTKHTPGPWIVHVWKRDHKTSKGESQPRFQYQVATATGEPIETATKNEANARLIAVAPEMFLGLINAVELMRDAERYLDPKYAELIGEIRQVRNYCETKLAKVGVE